MDVVDTALSQAQPSRMSHTCEPEESRMTVTSEPTISTNLEIPHILVINDTQEILDLFQELLEDEGYRVSLYSYAFKDIKEIQSLQPDLVIIDFIIGGEAHGWQLLQKMKMNRETASIPIVACTAAIQLVKELEGHLTSKNVRIVLKPFDIEDLLTEVRVALSGRHEVTA
jgi:DNA-binding response OmpR family regulator